MGLRPSEHPRFLTRQQRRLRIVKRYLMGKGAKAVIWITLRIPLPLYSWAMRTVIPSIASFLHKKQAQRNLQLGMGNQLSPEQQAKVIKGVFRGLGSLTLEWLGCFRHGFEFVTENLDDAEARAQAIRFTEEWKGGWIGLTGHIGNWELIGAWGQRHLPRGVGGIVAKRQPNPYLNEEVEKLRRSLGVETIYREELGKIMRCLKNGQMLGMAPDQDSEKLPGVFVDFMGRRAYTPVGPARIAIAANVPIVIGLFLRQGDGYRVYLSGPTYPDLTRPKAEEILRLTQAWSNSLEKIIRQHPEQWPWFHNRWKTTPEMLQAKGRQAVKLEG